jgi:hypothetical protein
MRCAAVVPRSASAPSAVGKCSDNPCASPDLTDDPLQRIVGSYLSPMRRGVRLIGQRLSCLLLDDLRGSSILMGVNRLEHARDIAHFIVRRVAEYVAVEMHHGTFEEPRSTLAGSAHIQPLGVAHAIAWPRRLRLLIASDAGHRGSSRNPTSGSASAAHAAMPFGGYLLRRLTAEALRPGAN